MAFTLTNSVISRADVNRLLRELNGLDDFFAGSQLREAGATQTPPKTTQLLEDLAKLNKLNLLDAKNRASLAKQLKDLSAKAPEIQISFAVEPSPRVIEPILIWMRQNIHPSVLLEIGLQPNIGAGCVLRTPNREFDLSMRQHLLDSKPYMAQLIESAAAKYRPPATPIAVTAHQPAAQEAPGGQSG